MDSRTTGSSAVLVSVPIFFIVSSILARAKFKDNFTDTALKLSSSQVIPLWQNMYPAGSRKDEGDVEWG